MRTFKKAISMLVAMTLVVACLASLCIPVSAAKKTDIVRDNLVVWYDASNNSNGLQDYETTVWKDLTGNGNHMTVKLNETNYWTDNAFHVDANPTYFPDAVVDIVNGEEYTFEMVLGEVSFTATNWITLMCSDNDEFSLFIRVPNGSDTDNNLEFKYNDKNQDRPKVDDGAAMLNNSTFTVTFDMTDPEEPLCTVYVNGVVVDTGVPEHTNIADTLMWGHDNPQRAWGGDVYGFRFYDRCLTAQEVADNATADNRNYRNGDIFEPEQEYDDSNEVIGGEDGVTYTNNIVTLTEKTDLVPSIGEYGCLNVHNLHFYGEHQGVKIMPTTDDSGNITGSPLLYVNYAKFVRRAGLENLNADDVKYVAVKLKVVGEIEDLLIWGLAGDMNSIYDNPEHLLADNLPLCNGESEYLLFNMEDVWTGLINQFAFQILDPAPDAVVYIEEIALFADQVGAYDYAGMTIEENTKAPETPAPETAPETTPETAPATDAPATEAPTTEAEGGCGSVIGFSAIALLAAAAAAVALKKD